MKGLLTLLGGLAIGLAAAAHAQARVQPDRDPDVPATGCRLYNTHHHADSSRSYQLTCAAPVPDSIVVYPARTP